MLQMMQFRGGRSAGGGDELSLVESFYGTGGGLGLVETREAGDLVLIAAQARNLAIDLVTDFTDIQDLPGGGTAPLRLMYKIVTSSESGGLTVTAGSASVRAQAWVFRSTSGASSIGSSYGAEEAASSSAIVSGSLSPVAGGAIVCVVASPSTAASEATFSGGLDNSGGSSANTDSFRHSRAYKLSLGETLAVTATWPSARSNRRIAAVEIAP